MNSADLGNDLSGVPGDICLSARLCYFISWSDGASLLWSSSVRLLLSQLWLMCVASPLLSLCVQVCVCVWVIRLSSSTRWRGHLRAPAPPGAQLPSSPTPLPPPPTQNPSVSHLAFCVQPSGLASPPELSLPPRLLGDIQPVTGRPSLPDTWIFSPSSVTPFYCSLSLPLMTSLPSSPGRHFLACSRPASSLLPSSESLPIIIICVLFPVSCPYRSLIIIIKKVMFPLNV